MQWIIPGTTLTGVSEEAEYIQARFDGLFMAGGLSLRQVSTITGLEPYTIQNWVKRRLLPAPQDKRYEMEQLCRLLNINILRGTMPLEQIIKVMSYLNGDLADESDDLVDDTMLYFLFVRLAARARFIGGTENWDDVLQEVTGDYSERAPGAREKLIKVLKVMLTVWVANRMKTQAEQMFAQLEAEISPSDTQ